VATAINAAVFAALVAASVLFVWSFYRPTLSLAARTVLTLGFLLLTAELVADTIEAGRFPAVTPHVFLDLFIWMATGGFLVAVRQRDWQPVGGFAVPVLAALWLAGLAFPAALPTHFPRALTGLWLILHVMAAAGAYTAFLLAASTGLMYLEKERELRRKEPRVFYYRLPALAASDRCSLRLVAGGLLLLTLAMLGGMVWSYLLYGQIWTWTAKEIWSLITWAVYAAYLLARWRGFDGHRAAWLSIWAFVVVAVNFFGVNLAVHGWHNYLGRG